MSNSPFAPAFQKPAPSDFDLHELLRHRWSPRAFSSEALGDEEVRRLLEAARWAPSAFNEQPWRFLLATRQRTADFESLLSCLTPGNQVWAGHAAGLAITVAQRELSSKPAPNRTALYDLGQAIAHLTFQATAMGIVVHQMAGLDLDKARAVCGIPEGYDPVTAVAFGRPGDSSALPEDVRRKDAAPRVRKPMSDIAFAAAWGRGF